MVFSGKHFEVLINTFRQNTFSLYVAAVRELTTMYTSHSRPVKIIHRLH